jgi:predicted DNA-binding protein
MSVTQPNTDTISAQIPADLKQQIRIKAAEEGVTMSEYLRQIIEGHFEELEDESSSR